MSRYHSYISSVVAILESYKGEEPFVHFARKTFAANKKYGSRDRKAIASMCYSYFRTSHLFADDPLQERILKGIFLCESESNSLLAELKHDWNEVIDLRVEDKLAFLSAGILELFPFSGELTDTIDKQSFSKSFLSQPLLYIRVRPGKTGKVKTALDAANISYHERGADCLALPNATGLDKLLRLNRDVVVQDLNSQKVFDWYAMEHTKVKDGRTETWDCCAASGGKSLLLYDRLKGNLKLTVSDIRSSILANLKARLQEAGVPIYKSFIADLTQGVPGDIDAFDMIICDAPCTGSGTWSRTPEQLTYFNTASIATYAEKQKKIAANASTLLNKNGFFIYITCSVFKKENEEVAGFIEKECGLELLKMQYLEGHQIQADKMFVSVFKKTPTG
jgi:16S rRNA (cytosine967-C5)-methyltransferase